jgi:hypothetical protein
MKTMSPAVALITAALFLRPGAVAAPSVDHNLWTELLRNHTRQGLVDYDGFERDRAKLDRYLDQMAEIDHQSLGRDDRFAYFINLYNAWTIRLILDHRPGIDSIRDIGGWLKSPWKMDIVRLKDKTVSLDWVEHDLLRPEFGDPRVHFAVNCASMSCPPLRNEAYVGARLDRQLDQQTRAFINDPQRTRLEGDQLYLNKIFKWFAEDFRDRVAFVRRYAEGGFKDELAELDRVDVRFLDYDWSLNAW